MRLTYNGREYTLIDAVGRVLGWTRDATLAEEIKEVITKYDYWHDLPFELRRKLVVAGFAGM